MGPGIRNSHDPAPCIAMFEKRLYAGVKKDVSFPFLEEDDERRVVKCVVAIVILAMQGGNSVTSLCEGAYKQNASQKKVKSAFTIIDTPFFLTYLYCTLPSPFHFARP